MSLIEKLNELAAAREDDDAFAAHAMQESAEALGAAEKWIAKAREHLAGGLPSIADADLAVALRIIRGDKP